MKYADEKEQASMKENGKDQLQTMKRRGLCELKLNPEDFKKPAGEYWGVYVCSGGGDNARWQDLSFHLDYHFQFCTLNRAQNLAQSR